MILRTVKEEDLGQIEEIDSTITDAEGASIQTLKARMNMFNEGFLVIEEEKEICGYIESCIWNKKNYRTFEEIKDFPKNHNSEGRILYIIFLGVKINHRKKGYATKLINALKELAKEKKLEQMQLVAGEGFLVEMYSKYGFEVIKELSNFLPNSKGTLMELKV